MGWSSGATNGDPGDWLSLWSSIVASVLGGIISGGLTLGGVLLTIHNDDKKDFIKSYPVKKRNAEKVLKWARDVSSATYLIISPSQGDFKGDKKHTIDYLKQLNELKEEMLDSAGKVNADFYNYTDKITLESFYLQNSLDFTDSEEGQIKRYAREESTKNVMNIRMIANELQNNVYNIDEKIGEYNEWIKHLTHGAFYIKSKKVFCPLLSNKSAGGDGVVEQTHECDDCGKEFEWYYLVPTEVGSGLRAHWIPKDKQPVQSVLNSVKEGGRKIPTEVLVTCPKCYKENKITVK